MERSRIGSIVSSSRRKVGGAKADTLDTEVSSKEPLRRKTKAKAARKPKKDDDAPGEGELPLGGEAEAEAEVTSMLEMSIRKDLARYPDAILLTQVGSFFEVRPFARLPTPSAEPNDTIRMTTVLLRPSPSRRPPPFHQTHLQELRPRRQPSSQSLCRVPPLPTKQARLHSRRSGS